MEGFPLLSQEDLDAIIPPLPFQDVRPIEAAENIRQDQGKKPLEKVKLKRKLARHASSPTESPEASRPRLLPCSDVEDGDDSDAWPGSSPRAGVRVGKSWRKQRAGARKGATPSATAAAAHAHAYAAPTTAASAPTAAIPMAQQSNSRSSSRSSSTNRSATPAIPIAIGTPMGPPAHHGARVDYTPPPTTSPSPRPTRVNTRDTESPREAHVGGRRSASTPREQANAPTLHPEGARAGSPELTLDPNATVLTYDFRVIDFDEEGNASTNEVSDGVTTYQTIHTPFEKPQFRPPLGDQPWQYNDLICNQKGIITNGAYHIYHPGYLLTSHAPKGLKEGELRTKSSNDVIPEGKWHRVPKGIKVPPSLPCIKSYPFAELVKIRKQFQKKKGLTFQNWPSCQRTYVFGKTKELREIHPRITRTSLCFPNSERLDQGSWSFSFRPAALKANRSPIVTRSLQAKRKATLADNIRIEKRAPPGKFQRGERARIDRRASPSQAPRSQKDRKRTIPVPPSVPTPPTRKSKVEPYLGEEAPP